MVIETSNTVFQNVVNFISKIFSYQYGYHYGGLWFYIYAVSVYCVLIYSDLYAIWNLNIIF